MQPAFSGIPFGHLECCNGFAARFAISACKETDRP